MSGTEIGHVGGQRSEGSWSKGEPLSASKHAGCRTMYAALAAIFGDIASTSDALAPIHGARVHAIRDPPLAAYARATGCPVLG
eukprot:1034166-Rhodomonas_salina.1